MKQFVDLYVGDFCWPDKEWDIEFRCNSPVPEEEDMLMGYARWDKENLISKDGDNYFLKDLVYAYEFTGDNSITLWIEVKWS